MKKMFSVCCSVKHYRPNEWTSCFNSLSGWFRAGSHGHQPTQFTSRMSSCLPTRCWSLCIWNQKVMNSHFLLLIQSRFPAQGIMALTVSRSSHLNQSSQALPTSMPREQSPKVILVSIKLTTEINHYTYIHTLLIYCLSFPPGFQEELPCPVHPSFLWKDLRVVEILKARKSRVKAFKSTCCSCRETGFGSQHPHQGTQHFWGTPTFCFKQLGRWQYHLTRWGS